MTSSEFHPAAEDEFFAAAHYYEDQAPNLGLEFISAVEATCDHLCRFPDSGHQFGRRLRRFLVRGFPCSLIYRAEQDRVLILAVAHLRRKPGYWQQRA